MTSVLTILKLALGLPNGRPSCIVFVLIIIGEKLVCFHCSHSCFTAPIFSELSHCALEFPRAFPSLILHADHWHRHTAMGKPKKSTSAVGTSAAAGGKKGSAVTRVTDGGW